MRTPEDDTLDMMADIRNGIDDDIHDPTDPLDVDDLAESPEVETVDPAQPVQPATPELSPVPAVIRRVLNSPDSGELLEIAKLLDATNSKERFIIFMTPIGDIRCKMNWMSCSPSDILPDKLLFIKIRTASLVFIPKPGAAFDIGFADYPGRVSVVCMAEPQQLYPGIDLLCFMTHNPPVEKNGRLQERAPSVVSGEASNDVQDGEPTRTGERPFAVDSLTKAAVLRARLKPDWDETRQSD